MKLHTITMVDHPWAAFAAASAGGGTPPEWTMAGKNDPSTWHSPADAAGGLILWDADGSPERAEPPTDNLSQVANDVLDDLSAAGMTDDVVSGTVRATYASSGGRVVALIEECDCLWWVAVLRDEPTPRMGASERNMQDIAGNPTLIYDDDGAFC